MRPQTQHNPSRSLYHMRDICVQHSLRKTHRLHSRICVRNRRSMRLCSRSATRSGRRAASSASRCSRESCSRPTSGPQRADSLLRHRNFSGRRLRRSSTLRFRCGCYLQIWLISQLTAGPLRRRLTGYTNEHLPNSLHCLPYNSPPNFADIHCFLFYFIFLSCTTTVNRTFLTFTGSHSDPYLFNIT